MCKHGFLRKSAGDLLLQLYKVIIQSIQSWSSVCFSDPCAFYSLKSVLLGCPTEYTQ